MQIPVADRYVNEPSLETTLAVAKRCLADHAESADLPMPVPSDVLGYPAVQPGTGRHVHDEECGPRCLDHCDDSDVILTFRYASCGWLATYGVTWDEHGRMTVSIWAD